MRPWLAQEGLVTLTRNVARAPGPRERRTGRINGILRHGRAVARPVAVPNTRQAASPRFIRVVCLVLAVAACLWLAPVTGRAEVTATVNSPDGVNLRAGPGTAFPIITAIPFGAVVTVTGDAVEIAWLPVVYNGLSGYVKAEYLTIGGTQTVASAPSTPASVIPPVVASTPAVGAGSTLAVWATVMPADGLNLRQGPGIHFPVLITVPGGARVQVVGRPTPDGWYSVSYQNRHGWVDGKYLSLGPPAPLPVPSPAAAIPTTAGRFIWPTESRRISTVFSPAHPGIDIDEYPNGNNPVVAAAAGTVTFVGGDICCSYGLYVIVRHTDGYTTLYAHLSVVSVKEGQEVRQGTVLGRSGCTGFCTGVHVHFEIRKDGVAIDPLTLLPGPFVIE